MIYTERTDGTDRVYLDEIAVVTNLSYSTTDPGGCSALSCHLALPPGFRHSALQLGRDVVAVRGGAKAWTGRLDTCTPGNPWEITALGSGTYGNSRRAIQTNVSGTGAGNALALDGVIDSAIVRGLRWRRPSPLPVWPAVFEPAASLTVSEALTKVCEAVGAVWRVAVDGTLTAAVPDVQPGSITHLVVATSLPGGNTREGFSDSQWYAFDGGGGARNISVSSIGAFTDTDRVESYVDFTGLGPMTGQVAADAALTNVRRIGLRPRLSGDLIVQPGDLLTMDGSPVDLALVRAGITVRILLVQPDLYSPGQGLLTRIVATTYNRDTQTLTLTPAETVRVAPVTAEI